MGSSFAAVGHHLPPFVERAGVLRPIAVDPVGPSHLAAQASRAALERAGWGIEELEFILFATSTPDVDFPGAACFLQAALECGTIGALDVRGQCCGFLYGLLIADRLQRGGMYRRVLVAAGEVHSSGLDYGPTGAEVARLFGDGAGVALLGESGAVRSVVVHADGRPHQAYWTEAPASRQHPVRMTIEDYQAGRHLPRLDHAALAAFGVDAIAGAVDEALRQADTSAAKIDHWIVSHVFPDVAEAARQRLDVPKERWVIPSERYGHLTAAALPVALSADVEAGRIGAGQTVCLAAAGAGFTWGAAVVEL